MKWLLCIFLFAIPAFGQVNVPAKVELAKNCYKDHPSGVEQSQSMRVFFPAFTQITSFDGKILSVVSADRFMTIPEDLIVTETSEIPPDLAKKYKKRPVWVWFCAVHKTLYGVAYDLPKK